MAGAGSLVFASCTEFLREEPKAIRSSNSYYGDVTTLKSGLMGIYLSFQNLYRDELPLYRRRLGTDESIPQFYMPDFNTVFRYQLDANNDVRRKVVPETLRDDLPCERRDLRGSSLAASDAEAAAIVAEAKMLRAWAYFRLAQTYGPVPLVIGETTPPVDYSLPRAPLKDVYGQIVQDMSEATVEGVLPKEKSTTEPRRLYYYSAVGLTARCC